MYAPQVNMRPLLPDSFGLPGGGGARTGRRSSFPSLSGTFGMGVIDPLLAPTDVDDLMSDDWNPERLDINLFYPDTAESGPVAEHRQVSSCLDPSFLDHSLPFAPNIINSPFPAPANFLDPLPSTPYSIDSIVPSQKMTFTAINAVSSATQVERTTKRASKPGAKDALNDAVREKPAVSAEQVKKPSKRSQFTKDWKCSRCQYKAEMRGDVHAHISRSLTHDPAVDYADRIGKGKENMALHKMPVNQFKTYMNRPQGRAPRKGKATINQTDGSTSTASTGNNNSSSANTINNPETAASSSSIPTAGKKRKRIETPNPTEESPGTTESASVNASSTDPEKELRKRIYIDPKTGSKNLVNRIVNHTPEPVNSAATGASPTSTHADKENHRPTKVKRINLIVKAEPASPSSQQ